MLEPAKTVISICGGPKVVAEMVKRNQTNVRRWAYPKDRGGLDGRIPSNVQPVLLTEARERGIDLRPEHFFLASEVA